MSIQKKHPEKSLLIHKEHKVHKIMIRPLLVIYHEYVSGEAKGSSLDLIRSAKIPDWGFFYHVLQNLFLL